MTISGTIVVCLALLLLGVSGYVIWRFDPTRLYDHLARTMVQMAIAVATVFVAFTIFDKQLHQRNTEEQQREHLIVSSYLRSKILEAQTNYTSKGSPLIGAVDIKCDINLDSCVNDPAQLDETASAMTRWVQPQHWDTIDQALVADKAEVWQLMRSAPLVELKYFNRIIAAIEMLENEARPLRWTLKRWQAAGSKELARARRADLIVDYVSLVQQQSRGILATVRTVCIFNDLLKQIEKGVATSNYDDKNASCSPESTPFDDFFQEWQSGRERTFKERRDDLERALGAGTSAASHRHSK
ncbi:hypothetical protein [Afipia sp. DC4300-2b1]|uniref:hypothetical protein n=1 Tax=Afipia sp. DC4300-2b1 TaxID=2804672 RepID=UPI003CED955E